MPKKRKKVVILGGGVAGLSAAHELCAFPEFDVVVYEKGPDLGGKARSLDVREPQAPPWDREREVNRILPGNRPLPGEHGFRFFPGFYKHITHTMKGIPFRGYGSGVFRKRVDQNLRAIQEFVFARHEGEPFSIQLESPLLRFWKFRKLQEEFDRILGPNSSLGVSRGEMKFLAKRIWQLITTCPERQLAEYEQLSWMEFHDGDKRSEEYNKYFIAGITRSLVAARAEDASTFTAGKIFVQLLFDLIDPRYHADRVLNGPTNEVWLSPWLEHLLQRGVTFHVDSDLQTLRYDGEGRATHAEILTGEGLQCVDADYFILAVPVEKTVGVLGADALRHDTTLEDLKVIEKNVEWMVGLQIFLKEDVPLGPGHIIYVDSPWAITALSQRQFWAPEYDLSGYGDGTVQGVISVVISDWNRKAPGGKSAKESTPEEVFLHVWNELKQSHNHGGETPLRDDMVHSWTLDPAIRYDPTGLRGPENSEPLLINEKNSWTYRPGAYTRIPNLFLASDYVRTHTDLATMEAANEAARRAVNGILNQSGTRRLSRIWDLNDPWLLWVFRTDDKRRFKRGLPWGGIRAADFLHPVFLFFLVVNIAFYAVLVPITLVLRWWRKLRERSIDRKLAAQYKRSASMGCQERPEHFGELPSAERLAGKCGKG